uniref:C-type lectin galactose-binding isoform n=1 Tax=Pseudechis porphyriacus TaxID=8671 RepID=LECG_PSEPO|nr:RecName: Full=C-type lectin galactose-binding isoform; Short=CTL; AltName: Full=Venom C-type lectin galactose binding isoform; Flags: Precursor [Pseudechis porphyriacus]ABP94088.1 venom C-type lectin galactose binding isoform [Pseudechis porphyriacus]
MGRFLLVTLSLLVVAFSLNGANSCCCPQDWLPRNGFCYKVFNHLKNWNDAEMYCRKFKPGCHLASLHSNADAVEFSEYITDYLTGQGHVWIGLRDTKKKYIWEWTDRSRTDFLPWRKDQPDHFNNEEFCVETVNFTGYLQWNDDSCTALRPFLCQCKY